MTNNGHPVRLLPFVVATASALILAVGYYVRHNPMPEGTLDIVIPAPYEAWGMWDLFAGPPLIAVAVAGIMRGMGAPSWTWAFRGRQLVFSVAIGCLLWTVATFGSAVLLDRFAGGHGWYTSWDTSRVWTAWTMPMLLVIAAWGFTVVHRLGRAVRVAWLVTATGAIVVGLTTGILYGGLDDTALGFGGMYAIPFLVVGLVVEARRRERAPTHEGAATS